MEKTIIKKQQAAQLFKDTFRDTIDTVGEDHVFFVGKKMYIKTEHVIISVEFTGTATAFSNLVLTAMSINGILDQNVTPLNMIFKESKGEGGQDKLVTLRVIFNATGEYTFIWIGKLTDGDIMNINNCVINYIELFSML